jgi:hypothetical protein
LITLDAGKRIERRAVDPYYFAHGRSNTMLTILLINPEGAIAPHSCGEPVSATPDDVLRGMPGPDGCGRVFTWP